MSPSAAAPNYLGGIRLMLEVAHVCPRCGQRLPDTPAASTHHLAGRGCRPTVFAALPEPERRRTDEDELPPVPVGRRIHDFEVPTAYPEPIVGADAVLDGQPRLARALAIPWLRPPDLGEVL